MKYYSFFIRIENRSKTPVTVSEFKMVGKDGTIYMPHVEGMNEQTYENGLRIYFEGEEDFQVGSIPYDMYSKSIMKSLRIEDHGVSEGYITFLQGPILTKSEEVFTLITKTPTKEYKSSIRIQALPENLKNMNSDMRDWHYVEH